MSSYLARLAATKTYRRIRKTAKSVASALGETIHDVAKKAEEYFDVEGRKTDQEMIDTFKKAGVEVTQMSKADYDAWLAVAKESSYKKFAEEVKGGDKLNHGKFAESPEVVRLLGNRLIAGQTVTDSDVGLGERLGAVTLGATQTVGNAASLAVSTPIMIFDPNTRKNYNEQVRRLGQSVENTVGATVTP